MKKSTIFLLILIAFLFISLLYSLYLNFNKSPTISTSTPTSGVISTESITPTKIDETADWETYINKIYNISFQYPSTFSVSDELPKTKTQGGPKTALELTDSKNNYQISIIIDPAGFGPIFADKKITLDYLPTEGLFSAKVVLSTEEDKQYLSLDKKAIWYQFDNNMFSNLTIITIAPKTDTKLEMLTTQILSTFKFIDSVSLGTVTGNLCYPSEGIPPGNIVAKNISTGETSVQRYNGTAVDPSGKFSFKLNSGTYHFKFEIGTGGSAGYYNQCAKTMTATDCDPDENHQHLDVVVESGQTTSEISLCDFYYSSVQEAMMKSTF